MIEPKSLWTVPATSAFQSGTTDGSLLSGAGLCTARVNIGGTNKMKNLLLTSVMLLASAVTVFAGPAEDAASVVEQFKKAFDASDVQGVVKLFTPDAVFLGTVSPKLVTKTEDIDAYFQAIKTDTPRKVMFGEYATVVLSDKAVLFAGMDQFSSTRDGKTIELPARFTLIVTKGSDGWRISHFHSSVRPGSP
jgi:uncharacterized protein (TIGR02246 family)